MYKKLLYVGFAAAMLATTACSSEDIVPASEQESLVSFSVQLPSELQARSRAYGDGTNATELYYAVYDATTHAELTRLRGEATFNSSLQATVNLHLANSRTYELVFWAQADGAPYTINYANRSVTVNYSDVKANDNLYDAFYKFETITVNGSINETIRLYRPFAQVNIGATDAAAATASGWTTVSSEVTIDNVYSTLNFADGTVSGARSYTYALNTKPTGEDFPVTATPAIDYQSMVYVLVANDQALVNVDFTAHSATSDINRSYANVPVQRNYRTNIYGNILTEEANFTVVIEPAFTGENNKQYVADGVELIDANTYEISNAAGLLWLEGQVNENPGSRATANSFAGKTIRLVNDIDLGGARWYPIGQTGFGQFAGTFDGQGHVVKNFYVQNVNTARGDNNASGLFGWVNSATIKNLTVENATITGDHYVGAIAGYLETTGTTIENCHATGCTIVADFMQKADGTWDNGDKVGGIVGFIQGGQTVDGCSVSATTIKGYRDIGGIVGYVSGGTVKNCTVGANVDIIVNNAHNYKNYTTPDAYDANDIVGENHGTLENNTGTARDIVRPARQATVATAAELKAALLAAVDTDGVGGVVTLSNDIVLAADESWEPILLSGYTGAGKVVIEGNNFSISGLDAPLFGGGFAGKTGLIVNNLTLKNCHIVNYANSLGVGFFVAAFDSVPLCTFTNCHVENSSIESNTGARVGAFMGWNAGYNVQNDGPVEMVVTFDKCSVKNCQITADGSIGAFVGHAGNNPATHNIITNCTATDNTFNSTDAGGWRVGVMVGTAEVGEVRISGSIFSNNTLTQTGKTAPAANAADKRNLYGRFVPGTTGTLSIDGEQITE